MTSRGTTSSPYPPPEREGEIHPDRAIANSQPISLDKPWEPADTARASPDLLLPVATALADIPALALTPAEANGPSHAQASSLVVLMGRIPGSAVSDGGLARAMAGGRVAGLCRLKHGRPKPERML